MAAVRTITRREPLSVKIIKGLMYFAVTVTFVAFGRGLVWDILKTQNPMFQNDLMVSVISVAVGFIAAYGVMFLIKRRSVILK